MRRAAVVLMALFLVNLPFAHETITDHRVARSGREVEAVVLDARTVSGRHFVDYRLPRSADPKGTRYSARIDDESYDVAQRTKRLAVRVVPGKPAQNRPDGSVGNGVFAVIAIGADIILLLVGILWWRRRRGSRLEVVHVEDGEVTLAGPERRLTAAAPTDWTARVRPGERVLGSFHLVAEQDVLPGLPGSGLEQVVGAEYVVHGRVLDARAGRVQLELDDGFRLLVETGPHRIRADIRDSTEVRGTLCFTPRH